MKKINYIIGMIVIGIFLSCENEAIPYYNSENDAVRFSNKNSDGYGAVSYTHLTLPTKA